MTQAVLSRGRTKAETLEAKGAPQRVSLGVQANEAKSRCSISIAQPSIGRHSRTNLPRSPRRRCSKQTTLNGHHVLLLRQVATTRRMMPQDRTAHQRALWRRLVPRARIVTATALWQGRRDEGLRRCMAPDRHACSTTTPKPSARPSCLMLATLMHRRCTGCHRMTPRQSHQVLCQQLTSRSQMHTRARTRGPRPGVPPVVYAS